MGFPTKTVGQKKTAKEKKHYQDHFGAKKTIADTWEEAETVRMDPEKADVCIYGVSLLVGVCACTRD